MTMVINNQGTVFNPILFNAGLPQIPMAERGRLATRDTLYTGSDEISKGLERSY